jgi:hypothetical protein
VSTDTSNQESSMAEQFAKYADLFVAFAVVQNVGFSYKLADDGPLQRAILAGYPVILPAIVAGGVTYALFIGFCSRVELSLREAARHPPIVVKAARAARNGRLVAVFALTLVASGGLWLVKHPIAKDAPDVKQTTNHPL